MRQTFTRLRKYTSCDHCVLLFTLVSVVGSIVEILMAEPLKDMTDMMLSGQHDSLYRRLLFVVMLLPIGAAIKYLGKYLIAKFSTGSMKNLRLKLADHATRLHIQRLEGEGTTDITACLTNDIPLIQNFFDNTLPNLIYQPLVFTCIFVYLFFMNPQLLLFSMISIPAVIALNIVLSKTIAKSTDQLQQHWAGINAILADSLAGINVIKAYSLRKYMYQKYQSSINNVLHKSMQIDMKISWLTPLSIIVRAVPRIMCIAFGCYLVIQGRLTTGSLLAFIYLFGFLIAPASMLPQLISELFTARQIFARVFSVFDIPEESVGEIQGGLNQNADQAVIRLKDVTFSYNNISVAALNGISLEIPEKSLSAFVGESGSGKSTIFKLLCGFYQPQSGSVNVFGEEIRSENLGNIRECISILSQDTFLFPSSIYENIALAKENATEEEVIEAAKAANIHDFIIELPEGYNTIVGEKGCNLSGGQKQRICIARTIIKNSPVILLDEPTSSLDQDTEESIKALIDCLKEKKTVLVSAHRLSTVKEADTVFVMKNGCIVERGTHDDLIKMKGYYSKLNFN